MACATGPASSLTEHVWCYRTTGSSPCLAATLVKRRTRGVRGDTAYGGATLGRRRAAGCGATAGAGTGSSTRGESKLNLWTPKFDFSIANTLRRGEAGKSLFVGWEDGDGLDRYNRGMSVENLALEEYRLGNLPEENNEADKSLTGGGWVGWHNEGAYVHSLFKILCQKTIVSNKGARCSVAFLTPFHDNPIDLHTPKFYERRKVIIEEHFDRIEKMSGEEIIDMIFENDAALDGRHENMIRTLSAIAVGLGGRGLVCLFRALLYDYRHYSAGLPGEWASPLL